MSVHLLFSRERSLTSYAIRTLTGSRWSHVDLFIDEKVLIGALPVSGVAAYDPKVRFAECSRYEIIPVEVSDRAIAAAISQVGKPYDWTGALGVGVNRNWQDERRWFCSELAAWCLLKGGMELPNLNFHRYTPERLYRALKISHD